MTTIEVQGISSGESRWGEEQAVAYARARHGPDGAVFLDPYFLSRLTSEEVSGKSIIDIGCGAGPWTALMAKNGAKKVVGLDFSYEMARKALVAVNQEKITGEILVQQADAAEIPHPDDTFDLATSINVGCNLEYLTEHFKEICRILKGGGRAVVTAPCSFGEVFTSDSTDGNIKLKQLLELLSSASSKESIATLDSILRATFTEKGELVTDENFLNPGQPIWRRIPGLVVDNFFHHPDEYLEASRSAGLKVVKDLRPCFNDKLERLIHNNTKPPAEQLGPEYVGHPPFAIFIFEK